MASGYILGGPISTGLQDLRFRTPRHAPRTAFRAKLRTPLPNRRNGVQSAAAASAAAAGDAGDNGSGAAPSLTAEMQRLADTVTSQASRFWALSGKFMPMVGLFFMLAFVNTILDSLKDTLVITAAGGGAQVIPYLTVYAVLPSSLIFLLLYSYASQRFRRQALFNGIVAVFMTFFVAFALLLYPNHHHLHPVGWAEGLAATLPLGLDGAVGMIRNWTFTLFFCMSELWGDVCLGLLFWGLANDTTSLADAPTLYPLFGLGANVAQALAGFVLKHQHQHHRGQWGSLPCSAPIGAPLPSVKCSQQGCECVWQETPPIPTGPSRVVFMRMYFFSGPASHGAASFTSEVQSLMGVVLVFSTLALVLHHAISVRDNRQRLERRHQQQQAARAGRRAAAAAAEAAAAAADATPRSLENQMQPLSAANRQRRRRRILLRRRTLASSVPIRCLVVMSMAQGLCTNLMEFAWKSHIRLLYPTPAAFTSFLGDVSTWQGIVTAHYPQQANVSTWGGNVSLLMVLSPTMFERLGWAGVASATPKILLYGGGLFFATAMVYQFVLAPTGMGLLQLLVYGGALLYVFSKSAKFSLFKPAEEMVYISLDEEGRTKGKAAIDVVGSQAGKSGGSVLQQVLLLLCGGAIAGQLPMMVAVYLAMSQSWLRAVATLSRVNNYGHASSVHASMQDDSMDHHTDLGEKTGSAEVEVEVEAFGGPDNGNGGVAGMASSSSSSSGNLSNGDLISANRGHSSNGNGNGNGVAAGNGNGSVVYGAPMVQEAAVVAAQNGYTNGHGNGYLNGHSANGYHMAGNGHNGINGYSNGNGYNGNGLNGHNGHTNGNGNGSGYSAIPREVQQPAAA
ncbi:hypothetical protein VOLCADRAFT_89266 [Volvox carteri f. nagariensis]|uniref:ADP,ATP carrier protein n=1 Tax=Volvox carteri f. nagariensis TaxID=3068 RepID=D8TR94_VOLCA|nr:uncharacterized protein VOLCADRAFT_89266 [Volvox carteri f. nagariensis]EFJ49850.1 hypothetical protein VOLCADRAFT_89266 [Volvox carteri f. nagariensis]|eukprot:XP_002948915.1 hypothetical protein VOLCADRAFT_89266 [Volvox carteri f. nagariensis]